MIAAALAVGVLMFLAIVKNMRQLRIARRA